MPRAATSADLSMDQPDGDLNLNTCVLCDCSIVPLTPARGRHNQKVTHGHRDDDDKDMVCICDPPWCLI